MRRLLLLGIFVGALGVAAIWWFSPSQVLKRRTSALLDTLTLERGDGKRIRQLASGSLNALLAAEVELEATSILEANGSFDRTELESAFSWVANQAKETRFELKKIHSIAVKGDRGVVKVSLDGLVVLPSYQPINGHYEASFTWRNEEGIWRLVRASWSGPIGGRKAKIVGKRS